MQWTKKTTELHVDTRSNEEEALARIVANHLKQLQPMQSGAAPKSRDVEMSHIANVFKSPAPVEEAKPASLKKHDAAVPSHPVASSLAASPKLVPLITSPPHVTTQQTPPAPRESELGADFSKLSEDLVMKSACCRSCVSVVCFTVLLGTRKAASRSS